LRSIVMLFMGRAPFGPDHDSSVGSSSLRRIGQDSISVKHEPSSPRARRPGSDAANDACDLWTAGIPCLLYGPGVIRGSADEDDGCILINDVVELTGVSALIALDVCDRECV
jgi:hypothetical protein